MVVGTNQLTTLYSKLIYGNFVCHGFTKKNDKYRFAVLVQAKVKTSLPTYVNMY